MLPEFEEPMDRLDAEWRDLESWTLSLPASQMAFRPGEGWSLHEIIDHMHRVEDAFLGMMTRSEGRGPRKRPWYRSVGLAGVHFVLDRGIRVRIPRGAEPMRPNTDRPIADLFADARASRANAGEYFGTLSAADLSRSAAKHPVGGPLDFLEAIWFVEGHFRHHLRQVARLREHPGFSSS